MFKGRRKSSKPRSGDSAQGNDLHLKTYIAGEESSRLADMAKEFGLQEERRRRPQVRAWRELLFSSTTEQASMQSVYTSQHRQPPRQTAVVAKLTRMNSWSAGDAPEASSSSNRTQNATGLINAFQPPHSPKRRTSVGGTKSASAAIAGGDQENFLRPEDQGHHYDLEAFLLPDDDDMLIQDPHHSSVGGTLVSAVGGIIKGMVGPAILYLPHGFAKAGYAVALPIMALTTIMFLYSSACLLDAWKLETKAMIAEEHEDEHQPGLALEALNEEEEQLSFLETRATQQQNSSSLRSFSSRQPRQQPPVRPPTMLSYPELAYRALGPVGEGVVKSGIALMQSGVCLTYLIFVPQNLHSSVWNLFGFNIPPDIWLILMIVIQIPLSWIRDIRKFTMTNFLANALILYGLLTCLGFATVNAMEGTNGSAMQNVYQKLIDLKPYQETWFLFIGTSVLMFEGSITLLVPLQESVQSPEARAEFPSVYRRVILSVICFYAFFALSNWMSFGNEVRTVLTTSLPEDYLATSVQLAYSIAVVFTFPLQNFPALEISTKTISQYLWTKGCITNKQSLLMDRSFWASILVCLLAVVAVSTMDSLDKVVALMGSLLGCPIAFSIPPMIHSQLAGEKNLSFGRKWGNRMVTIVSFVIMIVASAITMYDW